METDEISDQPLAIIHISNYTEMTISNKHVRIEKCDLQYVLLNPSEALAILEALGWHREELEQLAKARERKQLQDNLRAFFQVLGNYAKETI